MDGNTMRIVLLGKTGAGKSSLANTIFGEKVFKESSSANSETKKCEAKNTIINGRKISLIDTPGLFDTDLNSTELTPEILKCIEECAPGPHAFLIVLKVEKFTKQEQEVVDIILKYFSEDALKYTTVVFTHGNQLEEGQRIEKWVNDNEVLRNLVDKCGGRCHVFDNKYWNNSQDQYRNNQIQVRELLKTTDETVRKNRGYYTNKFLTMVISDMKRWWSRLTNVSAKVLLGTLLGAEAIAAPFFGTDPSTQSSEEEEVARASHVQETDPMRIFLLGIVGSGKSSLANIIFGETGLFKTHHSSTSGTRTCQSETRTVNERSIQLVDPPGLFETDPNSTELSPEILRGITECAPGPHAFLIVLRVERFTEQEQDVVDIILKYFSEEVLKYTTVVFTHGDDLPEGMRIKDWVNKIEVLRSLVDKCGGRCHVFDNNYWNNSQDQYRNNQVQVRELLETIDKTVTENRGGYYTLQMLQQRQEERSRLRQSNENLLDFGAGSK